MKIFIDTAELDEIKEAYSWGIVDGVTTNPSLIKKAVDAREDINLEEYIEEILQTVDGPVSLEVIGLTYKDMVKEGKYLYDRFNSINDNVAVKIPINTRAEGTSDEPYAGLKAIKELSADGISVNTTLIMKPEQALLAAKAGADYVSPFAGRIDDYIRSNLGLVRGEDYQKSAHHDSSLMDRALELSAKSLASECSGESLSEVYFDSQYRELREKARDQGIRSGVDLVRFIKEIFDHYSFDTQILAASMRNSRQVREVAEVGADIGTLPFAVIREMLDHYKTEQGIISFSEDVVPEYKGIF